MLTPTTVEHDTLQARAAACRHRAVMMRRDAIAAQWRASGTRLAHHDLRVEMAWTFYQAIRLREGDRAVLQPMRRCGHPHCRINHCGRP